MCINARVAVAMDDWHSHQPQPVARISPSPPMEPADQIEAPQLVRVGRIAILKEIGDQLDDAALSDGLSDDSARTWNAVTLTDRMCMGLLWTD